MKFDYLKQPDLRDPNQPWASRPVIPVRLTHNSKEVEVYALVDSGADLSIFHGSVGRELGINITKGRKQQFSGISEGVGIDVYVHRVKLQVIGDTRQVEIEAGFTESKNVGAILGQTGFFDNYYVKFERNKERIEITPAK